MSKTLEFTVPSELQGERLDRALAQLIHDLSRAYLQKLVKEEKVRLNGTIVTIPRTAISAGASLTVELPEQENPLPSPEPFDFPILFEDEAMLVIDKPAGVVVHPGAGTPNGTVVNALLSRYPGMAEQFSDCAERPGIVHRLDKDTSGCLVIAKTPEAQFKLGRAFAERQTSKCYLAICRGIPEKKSGTLETLIGRHPVNRQKMAIVDRNGKNAVTHYRITASHTINGVPLSLAEVKIDTGRTHQIRVHLSSIKLPIIGDELYGGRAVLFPGVTRQQLHAWKLSVPHPITGELMNFTSPLPDDMRQMIAQLKAK